MKKEMTGMCGCMHHKVFGWVLLIVGILFLLRDFGAWNFWNIQWYSVAFVLVGLGAGCKCCDRGMCF
ncbi:MAG: hypothetical protein AABW56_00430 [Nanoarchaeota archaeon]